MGLELRRQLFPMLLNHGLQLRALTVTIHLNLRHGCDIPKKSYLRFFPQTALKSAVNFLIRFPRAGNWFFVNEWLT